MASRREPYDRQQSIDRIVLRLRQAIQREPLLRRLPSQQELARFFSASLRDIRAGLDRMAAEDVIRASRGGYLVVRRPASHAAPLQRVVLVQQALVRFHSHYEQLINQGTDQRCRELRLGFEVHYLEPEQCDRRLEELARQSSGDHVGWGIVPIIGLGEKLIPRWHQAGRRVVMIEDMSPDHPVPCVLLDQPGAVRLAVDHLVSMGHCRLGAVSIVSRFPQAGEFVSRMHQALAQHGLDLMPNWDVRIPLPYQPNLVQMVGQLKKLWRSASRRPTGLVVRSMSAAPPLLAACDALEIRIPGQLSIVVAGSKHTLASQFGVAGVDWEPLAGSGSPLTIANAGEPEALGRAVVDLLVRLDDSKVRASAPVVRLQARLEMPDASVAPPRSPA